MNMYLTHKPERLLDPVCIFIPQNVNLIKTQKCDPLFLTSTHEHSCGYGDIRETECKKKTNCICIYIYIWGKMSLHVLAVFDLVIVVLLAACKQKKNIQETFFNINM